MKCPNCEQEVSATAQLCECGYRLESPGLDKLQDSIKPPNGVERIVVHFKPWKRVIGLGIIIGTFSLLIYFLLSPAWPFFLEVLNQTWLGGMVLVFLMVLAIGACLNLGLSLLAYAAEVILDYQNGYLTVKRNGMLFPLRRSRHIRIPNTTENLLGLNMSSKQDEWGVFYTITVNTDKGKPSILIDKEDTAYLIKAKIERFVETR